MLLCYLVTSPILQQHKGECRANNRATLIPKVILKMEQGSDAVENRPDGDVGSSVGSVSEVQLSDKQKKTCGLIANNPSISAKQMSEVLSVTQRPVERDLAAMQKMVVWRYQCRALGATDKHKD